MTGHRRIAWVVALSAALLVPAVPAAAHEHPTPIERAAPAAVYVEARAEVEVSLVEHRQSDPAGVHISITQTTSKPVLASASGFVVDPTGAIVTDGAITKTDLDRASVYAVNEAFRAQYGAAAPLSGDPFTRQRVGAGTDVLQQRLEACYPPQRTNDAGGCVVKATPTYVVYPYVTSQEKYGQLNAELLPGNTADVAVLRVRGANSMPTVALGDSTSGAHALGVLGFTGIPNGPDQLQAINSHLDKVGGTALQTADLTDKDKQTAAKLADGVAKGMHGGPVVAEDGQVIGFLAPDAGSGPPPATAGRLVDAGAIQGVLSAAGVTPRRGPVDTTFEAAMHAYKNGGFAAAIPNFKAALALFPGHAMAANNLTDAEQKVAAGMTAAPAAAGDPTPGGPPAASSGGFPWTVVLIVLVALLLLAAAAVLLLRRRRRASTEGVATSSPGTVRPGEGQPAAPPRAATGQRERHAAHSGAARSPSGAVSVKEGDASGRAGAASRSLGGQAASVSAPSGSVAGKGPLAAARDGFRRTPQASVAAPASSPRHDASFVPATGERPAFCTSCGAHVAPQHRYCGRCGKDTKK
jgi:hypothetical protein